MECVMRSKLTMIYKATKRSLCVSVGLNRSSRSPSRAPLHVNISQRNPIFFRIHPLSPCLQQASSCFWLHQFSHELCICTLTAPNHQQNQCLINKNGCIVLNSRDLSGNYWYGETVLFRKLPHYFAELLIIASVLTSSWWLLMIWH